MWDLAEPAEPELGHELDVVERLDALERKLAAVVERLDAIRLGPWRPSTDLALELLAALAPELLSEAPEEEAVPT